MKPKIKEWIRRYLPANLLTAISVVFVSVFVVWLTKNYILAAFLASLTDTIVYYGFILIRDVIQDIKKNKNLQEKYNFKIIVKNTRNLLLEFGVGELLDTFIVRPFFLYFTPKIINNYAIGILVGKYLSDITFYIPTIISYELRKKYLKD
jgi:hypothetical protein